MQGYLGMYCVLVLRVKGPPTITYTCLEIVVLLVIFLSTPTLNSIRIMLNDKPGTWQHHNFKKGTYVSIMAYSMHA